MTDFPVQKDLFANWLLDHKDQQFTSRSGADCPVSQYIRDAFEGVTRCFVDPPNGIFWDDLPEDASNNLRYNNVLPAPRWVAAYVKGYDALLAEGIALTGQDLADLLDGRYSSPKQLLKQERQELLEKLDAEGFDMQACNKMTLDELREQWNTFRSFEVEIDGQTMVAREADAEGEAALGLGEASEE